MHTTKQANALRLADELNDKLHDWTCADHAADELRRLYEELEALRAAPSTSPAELRHDALVVNLMRRVDGIDKHKARECASVVFEMLKATPAALSPSMPFVPWSKEAEMRESWAATSTNSEKIGCVQHDCAECKARADAPSTSQPLGALVEVRWDDSPWSRYGLFNSVEIAEATKRHLENDDKEARVVPLCSIALAAPSTSPTDDEMLAAFNSCEKVIDGLHAVFQLAAPSTSPKTRVYIDDDYKPSRLRLAIGNQSWTIGIDYDDEPGRMEWHRDTLAAALESVRAAPSISPLTDTQREFFISTCPTLAHLIDAIEAAHGIKGGA